MFAGFERGDRHPTVVGEGRVDVDEVDLAISEHVLEALVAPFDGKCVPDRIEGGFRPATDRVHVGQGMSLIDRDELRPESKTDNGDVDFVFAHDEAPFLSFVTSA